MSGKVFLDLGCGDGRFTEYLINKGVEQVVCVDSDYKTLYELMLYSEKNGFRNKIKLINCGAENVPLDKNSVDVILALGVFTI